MSVAAAGHALRVLIVDDEPLARARLRTLLGDCQSPNAVVVGEAANAVQAMEAMRSQGVDVALLDIHMPGADGITLGRAFAALPMPGVGLCYGVCGTCGACL